MVLPRPRGLIVIPKEHTTRSWLAKQQHATKHTAYHELLEALAGEGCPVCLLSGRSVYRYLHTLAYENVTDLDIRLELRARRGFCHAHTWQFAEEVSDGLATAIIYRDVIHSLLGELEKRDGLPGPLRRLRRRPPDLLDRLRPRGECPACRVRASAVERHLGTLLAHLAEPELRDRFLVSPGLCLPHLCQALPTAPDADRADTLRRPTLAQQPPLPEGEGAGRPLSQREVEPRASDCPACRVQGGARRRPRAAGGRALPAPLRPRLVASGRRGPRTPAGSAGRVLPCRPGGAGRVHSQARLPLQPRVAGRGGRLAPARRRCRSRRPVPGPARLAAPRLTPPCRRA